MATTLIHKYALASGTGTQQINSVLNSSDYSRYDALTLRANITAADTDSVDTLDIYLQASWDGGVTWDDRIHLAQLLGTASPSATAPETLEATIQKFGSFADAEEAAEPSGSTGASRLAAGTVKNGPWPGRIRTKGSNGLQPTLRLRIEIVDADADASFIGTLAVYGEYMEP